MSQAGEVDVIGNHPEIATRFDADSGFAIPVLNTLNILGLSVAAGIHPVRTIGSGNTITTEVQISQAIASTDATKVGLANFNSANFTVDANGFVSLSGMGISWSRISANQNLSTNHGYFCVSPGGALSLALPAVSALGDEIEVSLDGATSFTITQGAGQSIKLGNSSTTVGVGGSLASTQQGDSIRMICQTSNLKWNILSSEGNLTII